ncbi:redox-sensing transcriptional repressor Rex [Lacticaseibacillus chiayiensis]|uniref:Redox-sensing transcriptional repressor Rex n=1 Tax=Lacticaseibacillus chiayiensis TaxID=2100821 RepID=A0A4Q1UGB6_9LACO|nr:redox-sensing transcriptional repressor Rex [Lacticaseibacillus chiayiensis]QVI35725.1 redox-sensing transcriptional repressor Rex [Lacticaseibacillus chiayiensis]RXT30217.1 redox-sensing transcriptional repressor Rex [Lacticaseibacillus chiayiensis]RXT58349.1 redox-sensing transcriptional repressor Rex [Lacticaseibacillus chiayiensis]
MVVNKLALSQATIKRIPVYYRTVKALQQSGVKRVRSDRLSKLVHIAPATIRRDFSNFGDLGRSGYGYSVDLLAEVFGELLEVHSEEQMLLVGCGNLGRALLTNNFRRNPDLSIVMGFDTDPSLIGTTIAGIPIYNLATLSEKIRPGMHTAIVCVPSSAQASVISQLEANGITAILTFAPKPVPAQPGTKIRYIDLTSELQALLFVDHQSKLVQEPKTPLKQS